MPHSGAHPQTGARGQGPASCLQRGGQVPGRAVSTVAAGGGGRGGRLAHGTHALVVAGSPALQAATRALVKGWEGVPALQAQAAAGPVMEGKP